MKDSAPTRSGLRPTEIAIEMHTQVVAEAARLFNQLGYVASALGAIEEELRSSGLPHDLFRDGEQLAGAAFDYAIEAAEGVLEEVLARETTSVGQLTAFILGFRRLAENPPIEGGSPVFHAAVHSHEAFSFLEDRARRVVSGWRHRVRRIVRRGVRLGEIRPSALPEEIASIVVGTMEGAIFLYRLYDDASHLDRSVGYLYRYLEQEIVA